MEIEGVEQQIFLQPEMAIVGAVYSVNGYTGHVVLTTSDLENTSGYQTSTDVANLISAHNTSEEAHPYIQALISSKQDPIVAGNGISITGGNTVAIDTTVVATQQNLATEVTNRENADIALQGQIDAISASSDVVDIVGTYAELQNYDTTKLKDNDIIKVLQDSTQGNATTYYRWNITTQTFTLIGQEGPYYTKAAADAQFVPQTRTINSKPLSANITLTASDVSALGQSDVVQTTGTSTTQVMSQNAVTTALATKLDSADVPAGFFDGSATTSPTPATSVELNNVLKLSDLQLLGDTTQDTTTGKNLVDALNATWVTSNATLTKTDNVFEMTATSGQLSRCNLPLTGLVDGTTYTLSFDVHGVSVSSISGLSYVRIRETATSGSWVSDSAIIEQTADYTRLNITFTATSVSNPYVWFYISASASNTNNIEIYVKNLQLEAGSTPTAYEPYTGGASPNPDYPQTVEVVTGEQTISVSDGTNSTDYTVDLGSIELSKIGNYQDYIYQGNDGWYIHKATGKRDVTSISSIYPSAGSGYIGAQFDVTDMASNSRINGYCNILIPMNSPSGATTEGITFGAGNTYVYVILKDSRMASSTVANWNAWLASNTTTIYYPLATPTDTKITDTTLTGQLDALLSAQIYPEYTLISSNGDLPAILGITAYNSNLNGIIEVLASTASTLGNINSALNIINNGGN